MKKNKKTKKKNMKKKIKKKTRIMNLRKKQSGGWLNRYNSAYAG